MAIGRSCRRWVQLLRRLVARAHGRELGTLLDLHPTEYGE